MRQSSATRTLLTIARTDTEAVEVREAAVAALADPLTTGSIGGAAGATRLDPCELLRPRQP